MMFDRKTPARGDVTYRWSKTVVLQMVDGLRDWVLRLQHFLSAGRGCSIDPEGDRLTTLFETSSKVTDPDADESLAPYWMVMRTTNDSKMPTGLRSAYRRFRDRNSRDEARRQRWRRQYVRLADIEHSSRAVETFEALTGHRLDPAPERSDDDRDLNGDSTARRPGSGTPIAATIMAAYLLVVAGGFFLDGPPRLDAGVSRSDVVWVGIGDLTRGPGAALEETLRVRYLAEVKRARKARRTTIGLHSSYDYTSLELVRLEMLDIMELHSTIGRIPARMHMLYGKICLLTGEREEARQSLAIAANRGGRAGRAATELLAEL